MKNGIELLNQLKEQLKEHKEKARADFLRRFDEQSDDCSMIIHGRSDELTEKLLEAKISILEDGGVSSFDYWTDKDGNRISVNGFIGKYGFCYRVADHDGNIFYTSSEAKLQKLGFVKKTELLPAWACVSSGNGNGFNGLLSASVIIFKSDTNYHTGQ